MRALTRVTFGVLAVSVLSALAYVCFESDAAVVKPTAASVDAVPPASPGGAASAPALAKTPPAEPKPIPYHLITTVARDENRTIYTTNELGEPMEVHPDGSFVIYNHRQLIRYGDGREEIRFTTIRGKPAAAQSIAEEPTETTPK